MNIVRKFSHLSDIIYEKFNVEITIRVIHSNYRGKTHYGYVYNM